MCFKVHDIIGEHYKTVGLDDVAQVVTELIPINAKRQRQIVLACQKLVAGEEYIHDYGDTAILIQRTKG